MKLGGTHPYANADDHVVKCDMWCANADLQVVAVIYIKQFESEGSTNFCYIFPMETSTHIHLYVVTFMA